MDPSECSSSKRLQVNEEGLIVPKKLPNPCLESREAQDLNRQIRWNVKAGINVLGGKSELELAIERRNRFRIEQEKKTELELSKTPFQKILEERAKRIEDLEKDGSSSGDSGHCSPEPESEFLKVHAQLKQVKVGRSCH